MRTFLTSWGRLSAFCRSMGTMDIGTVRGAAAEGGTTTLEGSMMSQEGCNMSLEEAFGCRGRHNRF